MKIEANTRTQCALGRYLTRKDTGAGLGTGHWTGGGAVMGGWGVGAVMGATLASAAVYSLIQADW